jgi:ribose transport system permease protein
MADDRQRVTEPELRPRKGTAAAVKGHRLGTDVRVLGQRAALVVTWAVVVAVFGALRPGTFLTTGNFQTIFGTNAVLVVLVLGLLVPLTTGDFDLSIGGTLTVSAMLTAILNVHDHWDIVPAMLAAVAMGVFVGFVNGALVVLLEIDSFIVTLGTGTVLQGVVQWISNFQSVTGVSNNLLNWVVTHRLLGISVVFYYALGICVAMWYVFEQMPLGRRLLFVGRGRNVSRLNGLHVGRLRWGALMTSGGVAALAGVLYLGTSGGADPSSGLSFLLPAFAAAFLGATAIRPGRFNPWGALIAVYFLVTGITGLQLLGANTYVQPLFYGGALVVAVALSQVVRRRALRDEAAARSD